MSAPLRLGLVVGPDETWSFIRDLYVDWQGHFQVDVFEPSQTRSPFFKERLNRRTLTNAMSAFLATHDVVFFEWASLWLALASRLDSPARLVTRLHRYELYQWADQIQWDRVDTIILVSEAKRREFLRRFPEQGAKCVVVPAGVDLGRFAFRPKPVQGRLGTLCHLSPRKRVYDLILCFSALAQEDGGVSLRIGGGPAPGYGDYTAALHHLVEQLGLRERVTFDGPVQDPAAWYSEIDLFISNSYSEGLQVAPIEAMASGCCTLSHHWDGAEEFLPGRNLFWTEAECRRLALDYLRLPPTDQAQRMAEMRALAETRFDSRAIAAQVRQILAMGHIR